MMNEPETQDSSWAKDTEHLPPAENEFTPLDARVLSLWRQDNLFSYGVVLALLAGVAVLAYFFFRFLLIPAIALFLVILACAAWAILWYAPRSYAAAGYRLEERVLLIRRGVWWQTTQLLPLSRIQHVDMNRGLLERRLGLASLVLYTAGTHSAAISLSGLDADEAVRLRDHLVAAGGDDAV